MDEARSSDTAPPEEGKIPLGETENLPKWASQDGDARKEEGAWDSLEKTKHVNDKRWLAVYGWVLLAITLVFALTFLAALIAWTWHYIAPECWHWLSSNQLSKIQSVLFSGGMGAIISGIIRAQLGKIQ